MKDSNIKEEDKISNSQSDIMSDGEVNSSFEKDDDHSSLSSKNENENDKNIIHLNKTLEKIHENDEDNLSTNRETKELIDAFPLDQDPNELVTNLRLKIEQLEEQVLNLRKKNDELKKDNIQNNSKIRRMSFVGNRKNFTLGNTDNEIKIKMAVLLKEKNDLQEINENMLNMLTEKELENQELQENFTNYKNQIKSEVQKYIDTIEKLQEKIGTLEENSQNKENYDKNLDEIIGEYQRYKERMEKSLNETLKKKDELVVELQDKEMRIQNMKSEIQNLEMENMQLTSQTEKKEKEYNNDMTNIDILLRENEKLKNEIINWQQRIKVVENNSQSHIDSKEEEIKLIKQDLEFKSKDFSKLKEEKNKEISFLKNEINKNNRDMNNLIKKNESIQKEIDELKNNLTIIKNKLEKKTKELHNINESAKKLIEYKDNLISEYESKIEEINKDKTLLIDQNHDLLDKVTNMNSSHLGEILDEEDDEEDNNKDNNENLLLKAEVKSLKEQLENQANDLISLNAMEKEVSRLKLENEKLEKDNKDLKEKMNKKKYDSEKEDLMKMIKKQYNNTIGNGQKGRKRMSVAMVKENLKNNIFNNNLEKQVGILKKIQQDEKKKMSDEIDKLKEDITLLKIKYYNQDLENETIIAKYKSILKSIGYECKKKGIKLNLNMSSL